MGRDVYVSHGMGVHLADIIYLLRSVLFYKVSRSHNRGTLGASRFSHSTKGSRMLTNELLSLIAITIGRIRCLGFRYLLYPSEFQMTQQIGKSGARMPVVIIARDKGAYWLI